MTWQPGRDRVEQLLNDDELEMVTLTTRWHEG